MNHDEHPNDGSLTRELLDSLSELAVPGRPPLAAITRRGRVHRRRRLAGFAGLGVTGAAAGIALALGLAGVLGAAPGRGTGTIQTAAFTLTRHANGTATLNLRQVFDPAALQRALAQDKIPALVKTGTYCSSSPAVPGLFGVLFAGLHAGSRHRVPPGRGVPGLMISGTFPVKPSQMAPADADVVTMVINPAAMPSGTELFVGYFNNDQTLSVDLIFTSSHTCRNSEEPPRTP
jgi:hypothetical protein